MTIKNSKDDELIRQRNKDLFQNAALYWNNLANERLFEISKQLLTVAFIILPLTGSIVLSDKIISPLSVNILIFGWIFLFISIFSGFWNLWVEAKYFNYLSNDASTREEIWSNSNRLIHDMNAQTNALGKTKTASSFMPLIIQIIAMVIGVFLIMIVVYGLLSENSGALPKMHEYNIQRQYKLAPASL